MFPTQAGQPGLIDQFLAALRSLPEVQAELEPAAAPEHDARLALDVFGTHTHALVEVRKAVYPRDVRELIWRVSDLARQQPAGESGGEVLAILVAEFISPGAKELLRAERVGYYDSGGSLYLPGRGAYLYVDRPPPKSLSRSMRSLFTGRRAQVLHGLLIRHQDWLGVKDLAELTLVSPATASQVLSEVERLDWLESRGQGPGKQRHLREPAALLDAWVKQLGSIRLPALRRYFVPTMKPDGLIERLGQVCEARGVEYAVSFEAAAQRYAPFLSTVSQVRCRLPAGSGADAAIADLGARIVSEGANLAVIEAKSSGDLLFRERVGRVWLASPIQVYLDLLRGQGRAKEMAEHLRRERIGF
ncbi:MAG: hypothetical protein AW08_02565 [Candidatus Accumulibacter adjunctus]|uniref:Uncharacterized protein n=1 Tax=Candidatus Accumulibacter adjunctus TaxID=1454001 RepID=A0A011MV41_9PROT|nr:MAG: hypothetical protein AW08_02565 [Candidatus Accumulibacter adjunctus]